MRHLLKAVVVVSVLFIAGCIVALIGWGLADLADKLN